MQINKFRMYKAMIAGGLGIAVAISIAIDTPVIALAAVITGIALALVLERHNKAVVGDERITQINGKAASAAFNSMLILAAIASLGIALFHNQLPENIVFLGTIMGYIVCAALILHICFYAYFSRKL